MTDFQFLQRQVIELTRLRDLAADDPILRPQLQERLDEAVKALQNAQQVEDVLFHTKAELPRQFSCAAAASVVLKEFGQILPAMSSFSMGDVHSAGNP